VSILVIEEGPHLSKFTTYGMTTTCNIVPTNSEVVHKTLNAVSCLPTWIQHNGGPHLTRFPQDGSKLKIVYNVGLESVVTAAMAPWKTALNAAGIDFDYEAVQYNPGVTECGTSGNCIRVGFNLSPCASPTACGCFAGGDRPNGVYTSPSIITLKGDWDTNLKTWVTGHEFGHLLGLDHADTCAPGSSVMTRTPKATCSPTNLVTATSNDAVPVSKAVYGGGPTKTCGW
jgi:hypothetical protein